MYAIVKIGGMQWKAEESQVLRVPKMDVEPGNSVNLDQVLLLVDQDHIQVGKPIVDGVTVQVKVLAHGKDKKINVFKKKRRKTYNVLRGHRQEYTQIIIEKIGSVKQASAKAGKSLSSGTESVSAEKPPKAVKAAPKPKAVKAAPKTAKSKAAAADQSSKPVKKAAVKKERGTPEIEKKE
ncbi:MAG TPA: 50S ribosomal protein L21 [bacterium]|nr:50S ribosomal protein L21 [bacterium]